MVVDPRRTRLLNKEEPGRGPVLYWMQRDMRAEDNWALLYAQEVALKREVPLFVLFNVVPTYGGATKRGYDFMLRGLAEVELTLQRFSIPLVITEGNSLEEISRFVSLRSIGEVVVDFNPLRHTQEWRIDLAKKLSIRLTEVDAHNIIPCWVASPKEEFAAYTFRPKVHKLLPEFLVAFPKLKVHPHADSWQPLAVEWKGVYERVKADSHVSPVLWIAPGSEAANRSLREFCQHRLKDYSTVRNDPTKDGQSNLSPYLHFGQLSAQKVALEVQLAMHAPKDSRETFLEELIVRRELTDNFCYYNKNYDNVKGAHAWAQKSIKEHKDDVREVIYSRDQLENATTGDELWNAAQTQMATTGKMHGWCRMYWAKKILEWTPDVQTAIDYALYLNDKYHLDGSDPNGVVGVMWSICGVHDRAWNSRHIFGKIRYMNYAGAKRKFDVKAYVAQWRPSPNLFT